MFTVFEICTLLTAAVAVWGIWLGIIVVVYDAVRPNTTPTENRALMVFGWLLVIVPPLAIFVWFMSGGSVYAATLWWLMPVAYTLALVQITCGAMLVFSEKDLLSFFVWPLTLASY
ncbi:hypothetical protein KC887_03915 [Candidatus Kaiserbacteria bacterium]|nr:hypothetical protein [Candidatus Kaiserbacteria bacterium]